MSYMHFIWCCPHAHTRSTGQVNNLIAHKVFYYCHFGTPWVVFNGHLTPRNDAIYSQTSVKTPHRLQTVWSANERWSFIRGMFPNMEQFVLISIRPKVFKKDGSRSRPFTRSQTITHIRSFAMVFFLISWLIVGFSSLNQQFSFQ